MSNNSNKKAKLVELDLTFDDRKRYELDQKFLSDEITFEEYVERSKLLLGLS